VILDVFSRSVTGWMVAYRESAELAKRLIEESCKKQHIQPGQLTLHADRGTSMRSKPVALLLADMGVTKTHSRPHVSDDNPFSESQFRTLKYRPEFPDRFGCIQDSRAFCQSFFRWYNDEHRHSGVGLLTPATVHYGQAENALRQRQDVLDVAYQRHPERFLRSAPKPPALPSEVWINKPPSTPAASPVGAGEESLIGSDQLLEAIDFEKTQCAPKRDKNGRAVGPSSWRSSFLGDPDANFLVEN
jgi:putative transposase